LDFEVFVIKIVDFLAKKIGCQLKGDVFVLSLLCNTDILKSLIINRIEFLKKNEETFNSKKLSYKQEIIMLEKLLMRLENE